MISRNNTTSGSSDSDFGDQYDYSSSDESDRARAALTVPRTNMCKRSCVAGCQCSATAEVLWNGPDKPVTVVELPGSALASTAVPPPGTDDDRQGQKSQDATKASPESKRRDQQNVGKAIEHLENKIKVLKAQAANRLAHRKAPKRYVTTTHLQGLWNARV